ncbi:hypothetical protein ACFL43_05985 [Thermodesulfobacteriota bacterium]
MDTQTNGFRFYLGFFLLSAAVLLLELAQARVFSVMLWHHLSYMVITVALLGFGCAGTLVFLGWRRFSRDFESTLVFFCLGFALLAFVSFAVICRLPPGTMQLSLANLSIIFLSYLLFFLPYCAAGAAVALVLSAGARQVNRLYCINMVGSGVGCLLMIGLISPLGGERTVVAASLMAALAALLFARRVSAVVKAAAACCAVAAAALTVYAPALLPVTPAPFKALSVYLENPEQFPGLTLEYSGWNPISRIDVVSAEQTIGTTHVLALNKNNKNLLVDGDAYTAIEKHPARDYLVDGRPAFHMYTLPYLIAKKPRVLIIGLGGGNDVFAAQLMGARSVTGCELNSITTDLIRNRYADFVGGLYQKPDTRIVNAEGRSFVRRSRDTFDLIQMTAVDTWAGLSSGAYVLSENYLYTGEAFDEYLQRLSDDGLLCIIRLLFSPPREVLRLVTTAARALQARGVQDPGAHIAVVSVVHGGLAGVLVKKSPFTEEEIATLVHDRYYDRSARLLFAGTRDTAALNPGLAPAELERLSRQARPFQDYFAALRDGRGNDFYAGYHFDVRPVTDNSPFFFEFYRWKNFLRDMSGMGTGGWGGDTVRPVALFILGSSTLQALGLSLLFILGPLLLFRRRGLALRGRAPFIIYFCCLGAAYMALEIVLMQKLVLFLGHPIYSISVVLAAFLISSGLGSLVSGSFRWSERSTVCLAVGMIGLYGAALILRLQPLVTRLLGCPLVLRAAITCALLFPLAFFMGMPFPAGLKAAGRMEASLVPWAIGINACASVTASVLVIVLAMGLGFNAALAIGLAVYGLGLVCFLRVQGG